MTTPRASQADPLIGALVGEATDHPALQRLVDLEERLRDTAPGRKSGSPVSRKPGPTTPRSREGNDDGDGDGDRGSGRPASRKPGPTTTRSQGEREPERVGAEPERRKPARKASGRRVPSMGYQPALDGLRAVSVVGVILYHAGFSWMRGGFFGVEVFFVVSGFLITSLLIDEREQSIGTSATNSSGINLGQFWLRRARRLLPALFTVLAAVAVWAMVAGTDEQQAQLRRDFP